MSDSQTFTNRYGVYLNNVLNDEISKYIIDNDLNDREFADKVGVARSTVTNWRNGHQRPSEEKLDKLSKVLRKI